MTVYLGKRDFVDHLDHVDPVGESAHLEVCMLIFYQEVSSSESPRKGHGNTTFAFQDFDMLPKK